MTEEEAKDILDSHDIIIPSDNQIVKCLAKVNTTSERKQTLINAMVRDSNMQFIWKKLLYAVCFYICFRSNYEYLVKLYSTDWKNTILKGILDEIDLSIKLVDIKSVEELIIAMYIYVVSRLQ